MTSPIDTQLRHELEDALFEEQLFAGTLRGEMASGRAATLIHQLESERRRLRGTVDTRPAQEAAWEAYLTQVLARPER